MVSFPDMTDNNKDLDVPSWYRHGVTVGVVGHGVFVAERFSSADFVDAADDAWVQVEKRIVRLSMLQKENGIFAIGLRLGSEYKLLYYRGRLFGRLPKEKSMVDRGDSAEEFVIFDGDVCVGDWTQITPVAGANPDVWRVIQSGDSIDGNVDLDDDIADYLRSIV